MVNVGGAVAVFTQPIRKLSKQIFNENLLNCMSIVYCVDDAHGILIGRDG